MTISNILSRKIVHRFLLTAAAKMLSAVIGLILTISITNYFTKDQAGNFLLGLSIIIILNVASRLGLDLVILRTLTSETDENVRQTKMNRGLVWIGIFSSTLAVLLFVLSDIISTKIFSEPALSAPLKWFFLTIPMTAIHFYISSAMLSKNRSVISVVYQNLGPYSIFLLLFGSHVMLGYIPDISDAAMFYFFSSLLISISSVLFWFKVMKNRFFLPSLRDAPLATSAAHLWLAGCMQVLVHWSGVIVAGIFVSSTELAYFSSAHRLALFFSFGLMVMNMIVAPRYSELWAAQNVAQLANLARNVSRALIALTLPAVILASLFAGFIMSFFGDGYENASIFLQILIWGQFVNVATGSVGHLLTMTGHEKDYQITTACSAVLTLIVLFLLTDQFGAVGTAIGTAVGVSLQNICAAFVVRARLGFFPVG